MLRMPGAQVRKFPDDAALRSHPDFAGKKFYVRKDTHRAATRKAEDEGMNASQLVQKLLSEYVKGGK
jgi:predicted HicB family RNase H-like nuclease